MRRIFTVVTMAGVLMSGALPAFADGNDVMGGKTRAQAWKQPSTPVARVEAAAPRFVGGEDQYLVAPAGSPAWTRPANDMARTTTGRFDVTPAAMNFFAAQSG